MPENDKHFYFFPLAIRFNGRMCIANSEISEYWSSSWPQLHSVSVFTHTMTCPTVFCSLFINRITTLFCYFQPTSIWLFNFNYHKNKFSEAQFPLPGEIYIQLLVTPHFHINYLLLFSAVGHTNEIYEYGSISTFCWYHYLHRSIISSHIPGSPIYYWINHFSTILE